MNAVHMWNKEIFYRVKEEKAQRGFYNIFSRNNINIILNLHIY